MRAKIALKGTSALHWAGFGGGRRQLHTPCWASKSDGSPIGPPLSLRTLGGRKSAPPARAPSPDSETQTDMRLPLAKDQPHMLRGLADRHRSGVTGQPHRRTQTARDRSARRVGDPHKHMPERDTVRPRHRGQEREASVDHCRQRETDTPKAAPPLGSKPRPFPSSAFLSAGTRHPLPVLPVLGTTVAGTALLDRSKSKPAGKQAERRHRMERGVFGVPRYGQNASDLMTPTF